MPNDRQEEGNNKSDDLDMTDIFWTFIGHKIGNYRRFKHYQAVRKIYE